MEEREDGIRVVKGDSEEAKGLLQQAHDHYANLKKNHPDVWAELYGSEDAPGPFPDEH